jgi:kinesin family protein 3/17
MEALKAEKERSEEEKQRIAEQLLQQHLELQSHYQVSTWFIFSFWLFSSQVFRFTVCCFSKRCFWLSFFIVCPIYAQALAREKEDRDVLAAKLRVLEEKLVHGSNNLSEQLLEKAKQKELELTLREQQLQEKEYLDEERERKIAELEVNLLLPSLPATILTL